MPPQNADEPPGRLQVDPDLALPMTTGYAGGGEVDGHAAHGYCAALSKPFEAQMLNQALWPSAGIADE